MAPPFLGAMHQSNLLAFVIVPRLFASLILLVMQGLKILIPPFDSKWGKNIYFWENTNASDLFWVFASYQQG